MTGKVTFAQSSSSVPVSISGEIKGLDPKAKRGFHIQCVYNQSSIALVLLTEGEFEQCSRGSILWMHVHGLPLQSSSKEPRFSIFK